MADAILNGWDAVARILLIVPAGYVALVLILRLSDKRILAKLDAFDFVVTIAIGSTFASVITRSVLPLVHGLAAIALLMGTQFIVTAALVRRPRVNGVVKAAPTFLLREAERLPQAMRRQRIKRDEIEAASRQTGGMTVADAEAVFLETDAALAAIRGR